MKKIEKLNAEIRTYGLQDHSGHIYDAIVLNNEGLNTEQALKRIADKVDELIDKQDKAKEEFERSGFKGICKLMCEDEEEPKPKQTCVQELNIKVNIDDESVEVIKANIDKVAKENAQLKIENEELNEYCEIIAKQLHEKCFSCRKFPNGSRKAIKFEDVQIGKSYLLKTKFGYFAGKCSGKCDIFSVGLTCRCADGSWSVVEFIKSEIKSIEELPE